MGIKRLLKADEAIQAYNEGRKVFEEEQEQYELPFTQSEADNAGVDGHSKAQRDVTLGEVEQKILSIFTKTDNKRLQNANGARDSRLNYFYRGRLSACKEILEALKEGKEE